MAFSNLPSNHFLAQPRPDPLLPQPAGLVDTTTLAAHDFDVDNRTGFMPPQPPLHRLPQAWKVWEDALDAAVSQKLQLAEKIELLGTEERRVEALNAEIWRECVQNMPLLPVDELKKSERALRRAHHLLCWVLHFYVQTIPSTEPIIIPRALTIPLLQVSAQLQLPPVLTYSDNVLYNWTFKEPRTDDPGLDSLPALDNLRCQTTFTSTTDEEEFFLTSARIEFRGSEALELVRLTMDEIFVGDEIAVRRVTGYLDRMVEVINELKELLLKVKEGVNPEVFYNEVRPWLRGADGDPWGRVWTFEGREEVEELVNWTEVSGATAGQSSLIQALDIFLGVDPKTPSTTTGSQPPARLFQGRMRAYMPRHHRIFLSHLEANPRPLRAVVQKAFEEQGDECTIIRAYNAALKALKEFRDAHMVAVALYVIGPARRAEKQRAVSPGSTDRTGKAQQRDEGLVEKAFGENETKQTLKGTGGTDLVNLLKQVRDRTASAYIQQ